MKKLSFWAAALLTSAVIGCGDDRTTAQPVHESQPTATSGDARVIQDFNERIERYMDLHAEAKKDVPRLKETNDPARIHDTQKALAARIREARASAKQGDIFTPEIRQLFRRRMYPELTGPESSETKAALKEEGSELKHVAPRVNDEYPASAPLPTVPPNLLAALPDLPEDLEYRIVNRDLILHDIDANIVVDVIDNAVR